jgi:hypothetical protein
MLLRWRQRSRIDVMPVKDRGDSFESVRDIESAVVDALRDAESSLERQLDETLRPLLEEIERIRALVARFEVSEEAVIAFLQTVSDLLGGRPLTVRDARRAGMIAAAGTTWRDEVGPLLTSGDVRTLLGDVSRQRVDELLRARRLIAPQDSSGRRQFPLFQFDDGQPIAPLVSAYWTVADGALSEWTAASWCVTADEALGGMSPVDWSRARKDPDLLLALARQDAARLAR